MRAVAIVAALALPGCTWVPGPVGWAATGANLVGVRDAIDYARSDEAVRMRAAASAEEAANRACAARLPDTASAEYQACVTDEYRRRYTP